MSDVLNPLPDTDAYDALIFDWDGTLVDSHEAHYAALNDVLGRLGVSVPWSWYAARTGTSSAETLVQAAEEHRITLPRPAEELAAECETAYLGRLDRVREIGWVCDLARKNAHRPIAVASGGRRAGIEATMAALGLAGLFPVLVTREDVDAGKPSPQLFLLAARRLGAEPARCLVLEDSDEGCLAAHRAGMPVVDIRPIAPGGP
ncbi:HAD family phosphatase [Streptomyces sp. CAU 1734]|uniref:HAD family hydrolase n=1 Tax=Streptomyces sp. CAU 1734 TaxID=3140360 RepID=UPI0032616F2F